MSRLLLNLRSVPEDEAKDVRAILDAKRGVLALLGILIVSGLVALPVILLRG